MPVYRLNKNEISFPDPTLSRGDGLLAFTRLLEQKEFLFIDCQFQTNHLESMGGRYISWEEYDRMLREGTGMGRMPEV